MRYTRLRSTSGVTTVLSANPRLVKGNTTAKLYKHHRLYFAGLYIGSFPGGLAAASIASSTFTELSEVTSLDTPTPQQSPLRHDAPP